MQRGPSFENWMKRHFSKCELREIAEHGADAGFPGLIYMSECSRTFDRYADEIWAWLVEDADSCGAKNAAELVAGFGRADMCGSWDGFKNLLLWYAAERVAHQLTER